MPVQVLRSYSVYPTGTALAFFILRLRSQALPQIVRHVATKGLRMNIGGIGNYGSTYFPHASRLSFDGADTDQNGSLSLDEFSAIGKNVPRGKNGVDDSDIQALFSAIDTDSDGEISKTEAKSAFDKLSQALQSQLLSVQERFGRGPPPPPPIEDIFSHADSDGSGGLSLDEFKADFARHRPPGASELSESKIEDRFKATDSDGDGAVSQSELEAAFAAGPPEPPPGLIWSSQFARAASAYQTQSSSTDIVQQLLDLLQAA